MEKVDPHRSQVFDEIFSAGQSLLSIFVYVESTIFFDLRRAFDELSAKIVPNVLSELEKGRVRTKNLIQKVVAGLAHQSCRLFVLCDLQRGEGGETSARHVTRACWKDRMPIDPDVILPCGVGTGLEPTSVSKVRSYGTWLPR